MSVYVLLCFVDPTLGKVTFPSLLFLSPPLVVFAFLNRNLGNRYVRSRGFILSEPSVLTHYLHLLLDIFLIQATRFI